MRPEQERRYNSKVAAPAANRPEAVGVVIAAGRGHSERMRGMVNITPYASGRHTDGLRPRVYVDVLHPRKVDCEAVVADAQAAGVVPSASDGGQQIVFAAESHGRHDVGNVG